MSTTTERSGTRPGTSAPAGSFGRLLRTEFHRFRCRRFIQVLLGLALLGWLAAVVIGLTSFGTPGDADVAAAEQRIEQEVALNEEFREQCLAQEAETDQQFCPPPLEPGDLRVEDYVSKEPFDLGSAGEGGALGFGAVAAVLAFLVGATWIGAEWSTRSLVALLFWETRRLRVMGSKVAVLVVCAALFGVAAQAAWLAMAGILEAVVGGEDPLPDGFWRGLLATQGRSVLLTVLAALAGYGLANLTRNTGAALGVGFVYFAIVETAIRILRPTWEPWLLSNNAVALIFPGGLPIPIRDGSVGPDGFGGGTEYLLGNLQAGLWLSAVTATVLAVGVVLFARRDIH
jgi:hypothetical protein